MWLAEGVGGGSGPLLPQREAPARADAVRHRPGRAPEDVGMYA
jgi:hypothetical protein